MAQHRGRRYHLHHLRPGTTLRDVAVAIMARWVCAQAHQQLEQELGLGHFEGRSWTGLQRHALMACIAFAYLQHFHLGAIRGRGRKADAAPDRRGAAAAEPAHRAARRHRPAVRAPRRAGPMSVLRARVRGGLILCLLNLLILLIAVLPRD